MTKRQRLTNLFFILFCAALTWGQQDVTPKYLVDSFNRIQEQFNCTFSFKDQDLEGHIYQEVSTQSLGQALNLLRTNTLFDYTLLQDKTVTVTPKANVKSQCIRVINRESNQAVAGALVSTRYQEKITDELGQLELQFIDSNSSISTIAAGFEPNNAVWSTYSATCYSVELLLETNQLPAITITNYIAKGITKSRDGGINIDYDVFDILPGLIESDVLLTLQALPGIQSVNETVSFLNIRGGTNDQNLILWDGIKMYQNGHFFGLISAFNPNLTKQVDVYKNGSTVRYGDGVSGVISMRSSDQLVEKITGNVGVNLLSADGFVAMPLGGKASLEIAARRSLNELWETPTYSSYFDKAFQNTELQAAFGQDPNSNEDFKFFDTSLRLLYKISPKDELRVNFLVLGNELDFDENAVIDNVLISRNSNLIQDNLSGGVFFRRTWNEKLQSSLQYYASNYSLMATNSDIVNNQRLLQQNDILESGLKLETGYLINNQTQLNFGYQFNETGITNFESINNPTFEREEKQVLVTHSGFSELNFTSKNGATRLITGLRVNHIDKFNEVLFEPRLEFRHRLNKAFTLEINGEFKSQTTTQIVDLQNDFLGVENRRWVLANPEQIPILKGKQLGFGISYQRRRLLVSLEPYVKEVTGISSQSQGFQNQFENARVVGSYNVYGLDFLANRQWDNTNIWLSYSYAKNDYTFAELIPNEFPNNIDIRHTVTLGATQTLGAFKLAGGLNWHRGIPTTQISQASAVTNMEIPFDAPNAQNIPDYFRIDASATYTMQWSDSIKAIAGVSLWNVLDRSTTVNEFYRFNDSNTIERVTDLALRFTPNFSFKLLF